MIDRNAYERKTAMSKHETFDYFAAFDRQSGLAEELALNLLSGLDRGELGSRSLMEALHVVEGDADEVNHGIQTHLAEDFVVPYERSGMAALAMVAASASLSYNTAPSPPTSVTRVAARAGSCSRAAMLAGSKPANRPAVSSA